MASKSCNRPSDDACGPELRRLELRGGPEARAVGGSWFTPPGIAAELAGRALEMLPAPDPAVLDPACGAGELLLAVKRLRPAAVLHGIDIDPEAAGLCRRRLGGGMIRCGDTLTEPPPKPLYDLVIVNPPFVALPRIPEARRLLLRRHFASARGRFNLWALFIEWSLRALKPGGIGAMILPDRLWRNTGDEFIRRLLEENSEILAHGEYPPGTFPDAVVDSGFVIFRAGGRTPEERRLRAGFAPGGDPVCRRIADGSVPLGRILDIRDGIIPGHHAGEIFAAAAGGPRRPGAWRKLLIGRDIRPREIIYRDRYVDYDPGKWNPAASGDPGIRLRTPEIFESPKILTRQTGDRIIAAWDGAGEYYYANTLHGGRIADSRFSGEFLAAYLSGAEANYCYRFCSGERGRPFAQVKISLLRQLPIPEFSRKEQAEIIRAPERAAEILELPADWHNMYK